MTDTALLHLPAALTPQQAARPALVGRETMTYAQLAAQVSALSRALRGLGAAHGDRVAIWMGKSPRYAAAIFGALHTGCAYVPLDGKQPAARVHTILADAEPVAVFTDRAHLADLTGQQLPACVRAVIVTDADEDGNADGDEDGEAVGHAEAGPRREADVHDPASAPVPLRSWAALTGAAQGEAEAEAQPPAAAAPDDLAAILYTSGSTGTPKGVQISYRNLANFVGWARAELEVGPGDVFANHASFNFDLSTFDLFTALSVGAAVWIVPDAATRDVNTLAAGIREHAVTVWYSVPSILHLLTASGALTAEGVKSLRYVLFAGEVFPIAQLRALAGVLPEHCALYNLYGPTETNVCTYHRVRAADLDRAEPVPIGTAISGARLAVLDADDRPVAEAGEPGALGELVVEGDCVTPGYWRREGEPAAHDHRVRRHRTGDLVSWEDGRLVYRGRKDRMVKLSGYRVELGEIEAAALRHPDIAAAAAVTVGEGGATRLALYFTLRPGAAAPSLLEIKRHCALHLPPYMVPHLATRLDDLPRNANGKTDYRRLGSQP
ncbi:D-alanine--poly(phosphoribitol) ligase [Actinocrinis puniceicyclus]|uniref:D-alanine--poly(Phosphoribitol) ligase n=1 Tax=Actinocrinis puniceicyclus TaxID=977794 RepID=A0A8J7WK09_9ACTN|nr:D-alanine--poly(phosphoribitol) ligase [Actinocrinis puniceicyclus]MBS2963706.1 D-alanine--poly(phosphoribitol) ligase [Actinocrinis puniceicyclus]